MAPILPQGFSYNDAARLVRLAACAPFARALGARPRIPRPRTALLGMSLSRFDAPRVGPLHAQAGQCVNSAVLSAAFTDTQCLRARDGVVNGGPGLCTCPAVPATTPLPSSCQRVNSTTVPRTGNLDADQLSASLALAATAFSGFQRYGVWWKPSSSSTANDGFLRFYVNGARACARRCSSDGGLRLRAPACSAANLGKQSSCGEGSGCHVCADQPFYEINDQALQAITGSNGQLLTPQRSIPYEPMHIVMVSA